MKNPILADPASRLCCVMEDGVNRCPQPARFWVGSNHIDAYAHVCGDHVEEVKRDGDTVQTMFDAYQGGTVKS